jgi:putative transposase
MLTELKKNSEHIWLKDADAQVLQQSLKNLDKAYKNFFNGRGFPKFKKKTAKQSIRYPQRFKLVENKIYAPKVGWVKIKLHRPIDGKINNLSISKTSTGKYFASFQCEIEIDPPQNRPGKVGIDLGIKDFAVTSDGEVIPNPRFLLKSEKKIKRASRVLSRRVKGSSGWYKAKHKLALAHEKVANQRADFLHKTSRMFVNQYGYIAIENLNVSGMIKNHSLAKHISDVGWSTFGRQLDYKGLWHGSEIVRIGRFEASSKTCSTCGYVLEKLDLSVREWDCPQCNTHHNRDGNAAINIREFSMAGAAKRINAGGECVRPACQAVLVEAGSVTL